MLSPSVTIGTLIPTTLPTTVATSAATEPEYSSTNAAISGTVLSGKNGTMSSSNMSSPTVPGFISTTSDQRAPGNPTQSADVTTKQNDQGGPKDSSKTSIGITVWASAAGAATLLITAAIIFVARRRRRAKILSSASYLKRRKSIVKDSSGAYESVELMLEEHPNQHGSRIGSTAVIENEYLTSTDESTPLSDRANSSVGLLALEEGRLSAAVTPTLNVINVGGGLENGDGYLQESKAEARAELQTGSSLKPPSKRMSPDGYLAPDEGQQSGIDEDGYANTSEGKKRHFMLSALSAVKLSNDKDSSSSAAPHRDQNTERVGVLGNQSPNLKVQNENFYYDNSGATTPPLDESNIISDASNQPNDTVRENGRPENETQRRIMPNTSQGYVTPVDGDNGPSDVDSYVYALPKKNKKRKLVLPSDSNKNAESDTIAKKDAIDDGTYSNSHAITPLSKATVFSEGYISAVEHREGPANSDMYAILSKKSQQSVDVPISGDVQKSSRREGNSGQDSGFTRKPNNFSDRPGIMMGVRKSAPTEQESYEYGNSESTTPPLKATIFPDGYVAPDEQNSDPSSSDAYSFATRETRRSIILSPRSVSGAQIRIHTGPGTANGGYLRSVDENEVSGQKNEVDESIPGPAESYEYGNSEATTPPVDEKYFPDGDSIPREHIRGHENSDAYTSPARNDTQSAVLSDTGIEENTNKAVSRNNKLKLVVKSEETTPGMNERERESYEYGNSGAITPPLKATVFPDGYIAPTEADDGSLGSDAYSTADRENKFRHNLARGSTRKKIKTFEIASKSGNRVLDQKSDTAGKASNGLENASKKESYEYGNSEAVTPPLKATAFAYGYLAPVEQNEDSSSSGAYSVATRERKRSLIFSESREARETKKKKATIDEPSDGYLRSVEKSENKTSGGMDEKESYEYGNSDEVTPPDYGNSDAVTPPDYGKSDAVTPPDYGNSDAVTPPVKATVFQDGYLAALPASKDEDGESRFNTDIYSKSTEGHKRKLQSRAGVSNQQKRDGEASGQSSQATQNLNPAQESYDYGNSSAVTPSSSESSIPIPDHEGHTAPESFYYENANTTTPPPEEVYDISSLRNRASDAPATKESYDYGNSDAITPPTIMTESSEGYVAPIDKARVSEKGIGDSVEGGLYANPKEGYKRKLSFPAGSFKNSQKRTDESISNGDKFFEQAAGPRLIFAGEQSSEMGALSARRESYSYGNAESITPPLKALVFDEGYLAAIEDRTISTADSISHTYAYASPAEAKRKFTITADNGSINGDNSPAKQAGTFSTPEGTRSKKDSYQYGNSDAVTPPLKAVMTSGGYVEPVGSDNIPTGSSRLSDDTGIYAKSMEGYKRRLNIAEMSVKISPEHAMDDASTNTEKRRSQPDVMIVTQESYSYGNSEAITPPPTSPGLSNGYLQPAPVDPNGGYMAPNYRRETAPEINAYASPREGLKMTYLQPAGSDHSEDRRNSY